MLWMGLFLSACMSVAQEPKVRLEVVASGFRAPLYLTHAGDGSGDLYVLQQGGQIRLLSRGSVRQQPFLDIAERISTGGERGLLGLAFHPDYPRNGFLYVNYTDVRGNTVVSRFTANRQNKVADPDSEKILLRIEQPYSNHNGGMMAFGPDGMLYIGTGDGGSGGDPINAGQRLDTLLGKILRIDVNSGDPYAIPPTNPKIRNALPEIWAYGLRNPWRFSFDRQTGDLWIGDVGQNRWEEIHFARSDQAGLNYGWRIVEGEECFNPRTNCNRNGLTNPVHVYSHSEGQSVTGGYVYRGRAFPALQGRYYFADFASGVMWSLRREGNRWVRNTELTGLGQGIASFGEDEAGELYVLNLVRGQVLRLRGD